jgi:hypothetical protein
VESGTSRLSRYAPSLPNVMGNGEKRAAATTTSGVVERVGRGLLKDDLVEALTTGGGTTAWESARSPKIGRVQAAIRLGLPWTMLVD